MAAGKGRKGPERANAEQGFARRRIQPRMTGGLHDADVAQLPIALEDEGKHRHALLAAPPRTARLVFAAIDVSRQCGQIAPLQRRDFIRGLRRSRR